MVWTSGRICLHILHCSFDVNCNSSLLHSSKNMIRQVDPNTFMRQRLLEELHLAQNNISNLSAEMFFGLSNLIVSCGTFIYCLYPVVVIIKIT